MMNSFKKLMTASVAAFFLTVPFAGFAATESDIELLEKQLIQKETQILEPEMKLDNFRGTFLFRERFPSNPEPRTIPPSSSQKPARCRSQEGVKEARKRILQVSLESPNCLTSEAGERKIGT